MFRIAGGWTLSLEHRRAWGRMVGANRRDSAREECDAQEACSPSCRTARLSAEWQERAHSAQAITPNINEVPSGASHLR
ncbi:hypothetical protein Acsp04_37540 [Actinomadura sp. NBRC 104425]|nr:hypothetical protein Acsp04_37540 [Actinomadura sp. NBRC 104425]